MALLMGGGCGESLEVGPGAGSETLGASTHGMGRLADTALVLQSHGIFDERATAVAVDGQQNIFMLATFRYVADFGPGLVLAPNPATVNLALVKYRWDGEPLWVKVFGTALENGGDVESRSLAVGPAGDIVVAGRNHGPLDFGLGPVPTGGFLARFSADGQPLWSRHLAVGLDLSDNGVAVGLDGNIALGGSFEGMLDVGTGPLVSASWEDGPAPSAFLASFNPQGVALWAWVDPTPSDGLGLAMEDDGDLILSGWEAVGPRQFGQPMVLKFSPSGRPLWSRRLATLGYLRKVAVRGNTVAATGHFGIPFPFAGQDLAPQGRGMLLAAFDNSNGNDRWGASFDADPRGLGMGSDGVFVTGAYSPGANLGRGPLPGAPGASTYNVFAARYQRSTGAPVWTRGFPATGIAEVENLSSSPTGDSLLVGSFRDGTVDFGTGVVLSPEGRDSFLLRLTP